MPDPAIILPWPDKALSPNARKDRRATSELRRRARQNAWKATIAAGWRKLDWEGVHLRLTFHPPDKRRRDVDNAFASLKSAIDGISDALQVDDSRFTYTLPPMGDPMKDGQVRVEIVSDAGVGVVTFRGQIG